MTDSQSFQVNLRGIIELLSGHLYSGPNVYVRELLQNSVDAISARRLKEPGHPGSISLELVSGGAGQQPTLIVSDDGIGLCEDEVHDFLATIGHSSKRGVVDRDTFIGQFGIGLLAAFMVANEIVLISKSIDENAAPVKWTGKVDGTYRVETIDIEMEPGSQVYLRCKPGCHEFFEYQFLLESARHYGEFLPQEIVLTHNSEVSNINRKAPWEHRDFSSSETIGELLAYGRQEMEMNFLDAMPINSACGDIRGVAYLLPESQTSGSNRSDHVYLKGMLVSKKVENLLPKWAFFVRCVLNARDLNPTASREGFHDDEMLAEARSELGQALRNWLMGLARNNQEKLQAIIDVHYRSIKALAADDDEFFELMIDWLPFETTLGKLTMKEIRQRELIRFVPNVDQFRQVAGVASSQHICLVNAGYSFDADLMEKMSRLHPELSIESVDPTELSHEFEDLTEAEQAHAEEFVRVAENSLQRFRCQAELRKFDPVSIPAFFTSNEQSSFYRTIEQTREVADELFSDVLDGIAKESSWSNWPQLCFNYSNPLVRKMIEIKDEELLQRSIELLYVQALLQGHFPLKALEQQTLNDGLLNMIELCVDAKGQ